MKRIAIILWALFCTQIPAQHVLDIQWSPCVRAVTVVAPDTLLVLAQPDYQAGTFVTITRDCPWQLKMQSAGLWWTTPPAQGTTGKVWFEAGRPMLYQTNLIRFGELQNAFYYTEGMQITLQPLPRDLVWCIQAEMPQAGPAPDWVAFVFTLEPKS